MKISVVGLGKLGLCTAACLASAGYEVVGMDVRVEYLAELEKGQVPFYEKGLQQLLRDSRHNLTFVSDLELAVRASQVSFIIVPTPSLYDGAFDNRYLLDVLTSLAEILRSKDEFHVISVVSTVMPGSCKNVFMPLLEKISEKTVGRDFGLAYNPEFIAIGSVIHDFLHPDIVLIGESDQMSGEILQRIYTNTCENSPTICRASLTCAEIAKLSINCFCTMKISFANNLATLCDSFEDADPKHICEIIGQDTRIGSKYIKPGLGFGGPCFPRDNEAFINFSQQNNGYSGLQKAVVTINDQQIDSALKKIIQAIRRAGDNVALLGLSYKPETYLAERSQAKEIACKLWQCGEVSRLRVYDPLAKDVGSWQLCSSLKECVTGANVAVILTPWDEFYTTQWHSLLAQEHVVLDFWNRRNYEG